MEQWRWEPSSLSVILGSALFFALFQNIAFWEHIFKLLTFHSAEIYLFAISLFLFLFCALVIIFSCLLWQYTAKPVLIFFLILGAIANYFSLFYGVFVDTEMVANLVETNQNEAMSYFSGRFVLWVLVWGILPSIFVLRIPWRGQSPIWKESLRRIVLIVGAATLLLSTSFPLYKHYSSFLRNNKSVVKLLTPSNYVVAFSKYFSRFLEKDLPFSTVATDAVYKDTSQHKKMVMIFVVGETSRAANFSLGGYPKETNPLLAKQDNLIYFPDVTSCGTSTAVSVPCLFSQMTRQTYSERKAKNEDNLLDILSRVGISVLWRENDGGCKEVCERVTTEWINVTTPTSRCPGGLCYDEHLLDDLDAYIAQQSGGMLIVLHTNGSHGPTYHERYPRDFTPQFTPVCETKDIYKCNKDELMNVYDNTILYVDYVLNQTVELLKQHTDEYETAMFYVSDHGESLGEKGIYLHSTPYLLAPDEQIKVPMIFWSSADFLQNRGIDFDCLRTQAQQKAYSHDDIFHSFLGLLQIDTKVYQPKYDLFLTCKTAS